MAVSVLALDWLLVLSCAFSLFLTIIYLFYSNRILALFIGYAIRLSWWNDESSRGWVSLESFQISLLSGRIMIKELRYHSSNQSFRAIKCRVTWRYWVWRTRGKFSGRVREEETKDNSRSLTLPCRIQVTLEGVEWLLYNRTASYNSILTQLQQQSKRDSDVGNRQNSLISGQNQGHFASDGGDAPSKMSTTAYTDNSGAAYIYPPSPSTSPPVVIGRISSLKEAFVIWIRSFKPDLHEILPIGITTRNGAIVCGNQSTPTLLVAKFSHAEGSYGVGNSRSSCDLYKTIIDLKFRSVKMDLERNPKYRGSLVQHGKIVSRRLGPDPDDSKLAYPAFLRLWTDQKRRETQFKTEDSYARTHADDCKLAYDYAVVETILEAPALELSYYWDEPGEVPAINQKAGLERLETHDVGNGDLAPQYGIDLVVYGGTVRYGPWADRQRVELQRLFFPPTYQSAEPTIPLKAGDKRMYTELKLFFELRDTTTFHIPFKEPSKDWRFDETKFPGSTRKKREGGWLEVHAGGNSTITYVMPWVATADGYDTLVELHLDEVTTLSSVNDIQILRAESSRILCELPVPLRWNDPRTWTFNVWFRKPIFYMIRDHINLLTDLGKDWSSGPPSDYERWIPMHYVVNSSMQDFELNLFLNDHNIITHPHTRNANTLLTLRGASLQSCANIPSDVFRPERTKIPFWVEAPDVKFILTLPRWNTHALFATSRTTDFALVKLLRLDGSFLYHSETRPEFIDQLRLDGLGRGVVFIAFGWVIRQLMIVRDNYFGNFTHFSTLSEYVAKRSRNQPVGDPVELKWREGKSNVFEVSLGVRFEDSMVVLPAGFTGYEYSLDHPTEAQPSPIAEPKGLGTCVIIKQPELQVHLRTHDYSMEMSLNISPVTTSVVEDVVHSLAHESYQVLGEERLHIDGINIVANRLFGPQPRTSTYLCIWEIQVGAISGAASAMDIRGIAAALTSFRFNFSDDVNAPAKEFALPSEPDVTFLKVSLNSVDLAWVTDHISIYLSLPDGLSFDYTDLPGKFYKKLTEVRIKRGSIRALMSSAPNRETWLEAGSICFDAGMDIYMSPSNWREAAETQMKFVAAQDALTRRAWFLYDDSPTRNGLSYRFSMFLPRPYLPRQSTPSVPANVHPVNVTPRKSRIRPIIETDHDSDSQEEHISEADRDARLAHSRPETPSLFNNDYDNRSISSSDESDDADVTSDVSDSESDGLENTEVNVKGADHTIPEFTHYKNILRRFESHLQDGFASWNTSLFTLVRDVAPVKEPPSKVTPRSSSPEYYQGGDASPSGDDLGSTIRLFRSKSIDVLLTPLCVHVIRQVFEAVFGLSTSMELLVDSLTTTYLGDVILENNFKPSSNTSDIEVSMFRVRILQSLMTVDEASGPLLRVSSPSNHPLLSPGNSRMLSDVTVSLHDLSSTFAQTTKPPDPHIISPSITFRGSFSRFSFSLDTSVIHTFPRMNTSRKVTPQCTINIERSTAAYNEGSFYVTLGDMGIRLLEKMSPTMVAATADSINHVIKMSREIYQDRFTQSATKKQGILWSILHYCRDLHIGDPLTQTQPSFLVQVGFPLQLRLDPSWKLFMYLRHCLRHLSPLYRGTLLQKSSTRSSLPSVKVDDLYPMLTAQLQEWSNELDWKEMGRLPFLRYCFKELSQPVERGETPTPSLAFHSGTFIFALIQHPSTSGNDTNTISFGPLRIAYRHHNQSTVLITHNTSGGIAPTLQPNYDSSKPMRHHILTATVESIGVTIHPTFIVFLQQILHLHGRYIRRSPTKAAHSPRFDVPSISAALDNHWEIFVKIPMISIQAAVESMVLEVGLENTNLAIPLLRTSVQSRSQHKDQQELSSNCLLKVSQFYTRVRQALDKTTPFQSTERDILTSLIFSSVTIHASGHFFGENPLAIKGLVALGSVQLSVPRSALLTYRLIEEWRTQYLPNIHSMTQDLLADLDKRSERQSRTPGPKKATKRFSSPVFDLRMSVKQVGVELQVMHGTWFSWDVYDIMVLLRNAAEARQSPGFTFGVQLVSQIIQIGAQSVEDGGTGKTVKVALPSFRSSGNYDGVRLQSHAIIDHFSLTLKPRYMDDILVVQQNLGTHFYDVLDLVAETRRNRPTPKKTPPVAIKYDVAFMLQGFRIGIVGPTTILDLTSTQMTGTAKNEAGLAWDFAVSNLALALSHHSSHPRPQSGFDRKLRSAYMILDLKASSSPTSSTSNTMSSHVLRLQVGRMHAVMSPNSIGELGDLVDHFQAEKILRQEQRAHELEEIKKKTKRVMRTFEVEKPTASLKRSTSILDNRTVLINIADIGIAFPLALGDEIEVDTVGSVPAFLMSIQRATFAVKRHESGQATMGRLSLQFVNQFDQSRPSQFDGDKHRSCNRLLYPGMKAEFQSNTSTATRQWQIGAHVDGFILDLDPSIVDNVFGLMDVYHKGRERVERLTTNPETSKLTSEDIPPASVEASYLAVRTSNILLTLVFQTGKVRLRDVQVNYEYARSRPTPSPEPLRSSTATPELDDDDADVIYFPRLTVCGEYRATPAVSKLSSSQDQEPSVLIFRSQIHTTRNEINPSLFPFLTGFSQRIEARLRKPESEQPVPGDTSSELSIARSADPPEFLAPGVLGGIQLSFSLSIASSRLELVCGHDLGVVAALVWESGGFLITLSPRSHVAYFAGSVNGLQVDLRHIKHQGGIVQTAYADARNLAFSVSYSQTEGDGGIPSHSISVVLDTEFGAALRFDRLQDILIFKAVYIDRIPGAVPQPSVKAAPAVEGSSSGRIQGITTAILVRARHIKLMVDLGHNVAAAVVNLETLVFRSRIVGSATDLSLSVAKTSLDLEQDRPLTGFMRLPDFSFTTIRRNDVQLDIRDGVSKMLEVTLTSGILDLVLQSERRTLLQYHAKPFDIRIADDWTAIDWDLPPEERTLRLDFSVVGTDVLAIASLQTIPKIIILLAKLKTDLQVQKTDARSALARSHITQLPKPDNALSEVADAMIRSARSKFSDGTAFSYVIVQHMTLKLSNLRFVLFKNPNDMEMAMFQGQGVNAELQRVVQELDMPPTRILRLAFSALNLSKYSALKYRPTEDDLMALPWLERLLKGASEATIARVPAMNLEMNSDVEYEGRQEVLLYDLVASADENAQTSRSIYVSLNLSLYIWAGAMVKGLGVEIEKALTTTGFNKPAARAVATAIASPPTLSVLGDNTLEGKSTDANLVAPTPTLPHTTKSTTGTSTTSPLSATQSSNTRDFGARPPRKYHARSETSIDYGTIQQLGEATPDAKAPWLGLKETVPPRVHEYATLPMEVLMKMLLEVYSKQLKMATKKRPNVERRGSSRRGEGEVMDRET